MFSAVKRAEGKRLSYLDIKKRFSWEFDDVKSACAQLIVSGLASEKEYSPMPGHRTAWGIVLTEEGRNSRKYCGAKVGSFLLKSVAIPVVVAIVTAILTTLTMQWFQH